MISARNDCDLRFVDRINKPMCVIDPARPIPRQIFPQGLGLANTCKRLADHVTDQLVDAL